MEGDEHVVVQP